MGVRSIVFGSAVIVFAHVNQVCSFLISRDCDGCWCVPDNENKTCPLRLAGVYDEMPDSIWREYASFELMSDSLRLTSANGKECYPFKGRHGPFEFYEESALPPCRIVDSEGNRVERNEDQYCAYKFIDNNIFSENREASPNDCCGRQYEMISYDSAVDAFLDGAFIHHRGACGVCSTAQDFAARSKSTPDEWREQGFQCAARFYFDESPDFEKTVECLQDFQLNAGFTRECAKLYGHYVVSSAFLCLDECIALHEPLLQTNETIPESGCDLPECTRCRDTAFQDIFDYFAGFTLERSGVIGEELRSCSTYFPVIRDPHCMDADSDDELCSVAHLTSSPTGTPEPLLGPSISPSMHPTEMPTFSPSMGIVDELETNFGPRPGPNSFATLGCRFRRLHFAALALTALTLSY